MKDILEETWTYRIMVILCLCILLVYTYLTNEDILLKYMGGEFALDTMLIWHIGIVGLLSLVLFYLLQSTLDYKSQNIVLKQYISNMQAELNVERDAFKDLKSVSGDKILQLGAFIVTISDMAKALNSVLETVPLLKTILRKSSALLGSEKCAIFMIDKDKKQLRLVDAVGYDKNKLEEMTLECDKSSGMLGLSAAEGKFYSRNTLEEDYSKKYILKNDKFPVRFSQPIVYGGEVLAIICIGDIRIEISESHIIRILSAMANFGAVAISNSSLVERIKDQSIRDSLTQLYNHQHFQQKFDNMISEAINTKTHLGFMMIDLDHFKKLNDTYGHQMGDLGLIKLAHILNAKAKEGDEAARYGGEEFAYISPGLNLKETVNLADEIRNEYKNVVLELNGAKASCTLSVGVSVYLPDVTGKIDKNTLIKIADKALYEAKAKGGDIVVAAKGV